MAGVSVSIMLYSDTEGHASLSHLKIIIDWEPQTL